MNFINNIKFLFKFLSYSSKEFSPCKIYQIEQLKNIKVERKSIEFGTYNYGESFTKFVRSDSDKNFFSNIKNLKKKNYIRFNLEKKNNLNKKFDNIIIFNVLEHIHNDIKAISELKKILKKNGKLIISTPFIYRYHEAPEDYKRYTTSYFAKILREKNFKVIKSKNLGEGPFIASYSLFFDYLKKIPLISYPIIILCYFFDKILSLFHKTKINKIYPICILIIAKNK
tara:strand:- start:74 stop:754 length:681 start_codon:yes stop_codon:yes gene_type:complete